MYWTDRQTDRLKWIERKIGSDLFQYPGFLIVLGVETRKITPFLI